MLFAIVAGVLIGVLAAVRQNSAMDRLSMLLSLIGVSMPGFWLGIMLILLFSLRLGWLPASGTGSAQQLVLPALALSFGSIAVMTRLVRGSMLEVLRQDYVVTARAKGLQARHVIGRHALNNALIPVVTLIGIQFGGLLGGAIIIETVFARQGIGQLAVGAIRQRDMPLVEGTVIFVGIVTVLANLAVDLLYVAIDPRIRIDFMTSTTPSLALAAPRSRGRQIALAARALRRHWPGLVGAVILLLLILAAAGAPALTPYDPVATAFKERLHPPSVDHPLGADALGATC